MFSKLKIFIKEADFAQKVFVFFVFEFFLKQKRILNNSIGVSLDPNP